MVTVGRSAFERGKFQAPLISIIIPCLWNPEQYLDRCINSVLDQTHEDLELILENDGSTDKSGEICDSFALNDERIKVIHKKNGGPSERET